MNFKIGIVAKYLSAIVIIRFIMIYFHCSGQIKSFFVIVDTISKELQNYCILILPTNLNCTTFYSTDDQKSFLSIHYLSDIPNKLIKVSSVVQFSSIYICIYISILYNHILSFCYSVNSAEKPSSVQALSALTF